MGPVRSATSSRYKLLDLTSFLTPALFLVGILRVRLARGSLADLALELGRGVPLGGLRDALARTLRDPTLQLAFAAPTGSGLVDADGQPFDIDAAGDRSATRLEHDGSLVAVLVHDPAIDREDKGLVEAVGSVARLALENERLAARSGPSSRRSGRHVRASSRRPMPNAAGSNAISTTAPSSGSSRSHAAQAARGVPTAGGGPDRRDDRRLAVAIAEVQLAVACAAILSEAGSRPPSGRSPSGRHPVRCTARRSAIRRVEATAYSSSPGVTNVARYASTTRDSDAAQDGSAPRRCGTARARWGPAGVRAPGSAGSKTASPPRADVQWIRTAVGLSCAR
jgi:hypothetical protein